MREGGPGPAKPVRRAAGRGGAESPLGALPAAQLVPCLPRVFSWTDTGDPDCTDFSVEGVFTKTQVGRLVRSAMLFRGGFTDLFNCT